MINRLARWVITGKGGGMETIMMTGSSNALLNVDDYCSYLTTIDDCDYEHRLMMATTTKNDRRTKV